MDAKKILKKHDANRVLKALSYVAGFPLFVLCVFLGSIPFIDSTGYGSTQYYGVYVALAIWLVVTVIQLILALVCRNYTARAVITVLFVVAIMVGGSVYFDYWAENKINEAKISYVKDVYGLADDEEVNLDDYDSDSIKSFRYQINKYINFNGGGLASSFSSTLDEFKRVYNVGYGSSVKGGTNTDGSSYGPALEKDDGTLEYWFGETGNVYKENGLYADGYVFGVDSAMEILITYYETQNLYKAQGKDADEELEKAYTAAQASTEWKNYIKTDEYKAAYGKGGTADSYMITLDRLDTIVRALGSQLYENGIKDILDNTIVSSLLDGTGITAETFKNLSVEKVIELMNGFGLSFTEDQIMELLSGYSYYQVSNVKPLMYFIKDETLRTYAYARYFGETHGANVGSVLIPTKNDDGSLGNIGCITMSDSGLSADENAFSLSQCYLLKANKSYAPTLYPLFAARRYAYVFAGIIALMMVIFYYAKLKVYLTKKKLEVIAISGGRN